MQMNANNRTCASMHTNKHWRLFALSFDLLKQLKSQSLTIPVK
jgi:hypothetical protein